MMKTKFLAAVLSCALCSQLSAQTASGTETACSSYPRNHLIHRQSNNSRRYFIASGVPTDCQDDVYNGAMAWTNSTPNVRFVWSGYVNDYAYVKDTTNGSFFEWHNTPDTWVQGSPIDAMNMWGYNYYKYSQQGLNQNPPAVATDSDHIININRMNEFFCTTNTASFPTSTQRDMTSHAVHEYGHTWGLDRDDCDPATTNAGKSAMWAQGFKGMDGVKRTPQTRDVERTKFLYGVKP